MINRSGTINDIKLLESKVLLAEDDYELKDDETPVRAIF